MPLPFFGKNKEKSAPAAPAASPAAARPAAPVNPDDFFKDLDRKPSRKAAPAVKAEIDVPEVTGLREAPPPAPECTIDTLSTSTLSTDGLRDKAAEYDGLYHGNMGDIDESTIDVGTLRPEAELPEAAEE